MNNICNICGANYVYKNGKWVCPACDNIKQEEITNEEVVLLTNASTKLRLADFDGAEELFDDFVKKYPNNSEAYWGLVLAKNGIKYEVNYDGAMIPTVYSTRIDSILEDEDYLKACSLADEEKAQYYKTEAERIENIRLEWIKKAKKEPAYDIFISFKDSVDGKRTEDSYEAQELYTYLTDLGYKVFFSRVSLRDKVSQKFEPYIFNALSTAKIMIVYGSSKEYIESTWVKNEWSRYLKKIKNGEKAENSLVLAYENLNPAKLPKCFSSIQCMDASKKTFYVDIASHIKNVLKATSEVEEIDDLVESDDFYKNETSVIKNNNWGRKKNKKKKRPVKDDKYMLIKGIFIILFLVVATAFLVPFILSKIM